MSYIRVRTTTRKVRGKPQRRYQAIWVENGQTLSETFDTRQQAEARLDSIKTLLAQGQSPASLKERGQETFGVLAKAWLESRHDVKPRTRAAYENLLAEKTRKRGEDLSIAATFNHRPINSITREQISKWITALSEAGKSSRTIRHHYIVVRAVLAQAVADHRITSNPAALVKLPKNTTPTVIDDPRQFLSTTQVSVLVENTPWPFNIYIHLAAYSGLRAGELAGLQIGDIQLSYPASQIRHDTQLSTAGGVQLSKSGLLRVERTIIALNGELRYDSPKTKGSRRKVPLTQATTALLTEYLSQHPRRDVDVAPLFPNVRTNVSEANASPSPKGTPADQPQPVKPEANASPVPNGTAAHRQAVSLVLDWSEPLRHSNFYRLVFKPAIAQTNENAESPIIPTDLTFHALRHTYASLSIAAGITPLVLSRRMGHAKVSTTLDVYSHLFTDDESTAADMAALEALSAPASTNVVPMRKRG